MKLYYSKAACSLAVRIVINELAIACEYEAVNLKTHMTENNVNFYQINAKGAVPALELDDGSLLTENNVIQQYLSDSYNKGAELLPKSGIERYRVLEWMNYVSTEMHKGCSPLFNPNIPEQLKQQVFKPMLVNKLAFLDKVLANHAYLSGERFCLADAYLFVVLRWLPALNINRSEFSHVEAYYQSAAKRPAVAKSLEQETLSA